MRPFCRSDLGIGPLKWPYRPPMYCITLRNKFDDTIVGWYDQSASHFSTDQRRAKVFRDRDAAELPPRAVATLAALQYREGPVFRWETTRSPNGTKAPHIHTYADRRREEGGQIKTAWRGALRRAGVDPELTPHDLRHTWANWYYALHRDLLALKIEGLVISGAGREIRASPPGRARGSHPCFTGSIGTTLAPIPSKSAQIIDGITLIPLGA